MRPTSADAAKKRLSRHAGTAPQRAKIQDLSSSRSTLRAHMKRHQTKERYSRKVIRLTGTRLKQKELALYRADEVPW